MPERGFTRRLTYTYIRSRHRVPNNLFLFRLSFIYTLFSQPNQCCISSYWSIGPFHNFNWQLDYSKWYRVKPSHKLRRSIIECIVYRRVLKTLENAWINRLNINFLGQGLTLYGVYSTLFPFASSQAEYSIDGSPATKFLLSGLVNSGPSTAALFNQILLTASFPHGFHEMTVRYLGNEQQTGLGIGFITIHNSSVLGFHQIQPTTTIMSTGLSPTQNSTTSPISHVTVSTVTDIPNAHTSPTHSQFTSSTPANSHKTRDILIAITIAASITAFFLIIAIIIIFLRKLHKSQGNNRVSRREPYVQVMSSPTLNLTTELPSPIAREQQTLRTGTSDSLDYAFSGGLPMIPTPSSRGVSFQSFEPLMSPRITSPVSPILQVRSLPTMAFSETVQARRSSLPMLLEAPVFAEAESVPPTRRNSEVLHLVSVDDSLNVINLDPQVPAIRPLPNPPVISSAANPVASREAEMPDSNVTNIIFTGGESREQTGPGPRNAKKIHMDSGIRLGKNHILQYKDPSTKSSNGGLPPVYTRS